jgi:uncharacterized protein DUF6962
MDALKNPTVYISGLRIDEPITTLTDLIVAAIAIAAFFKTKSGSNAKAIDLYRWFFLITGLSTGLSSLVGHAFGYYFNPDFKIAGWLLGIASVTLAQFAALYHTKSILSKNVFNALAILCITETAAAVVLVFIMKTFTSVEIHSAFGLLFIVTILEGIYFKRTKSPLSRHFIYGVGLCVVAVTCHVGKLAISPWFNHLDLSHVFMAMALYTMYKGVQKERSFV